MASRPEDDPPGLPPEWAGLVVPDDISGLEADIALLHSEQPPRQQVPPLRRILQTRRWQRYGVSGPLVVIVLLVVLFFASLVFLLLPSGPQPPAIRPLAQPRVAPGQPDGLLPDVALPSGETEALRLRNFRPAVVLLLPGACNCRGLVSDALSSTSASRLQVILVGEGADPFLPGNSPTKRAHTGSDPGGRLAATYHLAGKPIALFVRADGTVARILPGAGPGAQLHDEVAGLAG